MDILQSISNLFIDEHLIFSFLDVMMKAATNSWYYIFISLG